MQDAAPPKAAATPSCCSVRAGRTMTACAALPKPDRSSADACRRPSVAPDGWSWRPMPPTGLALQP